MDDDEREAEQEKRRQQELAADKAIKAKIEAERVKALGWPIEQARSEYSLQFKKGPNLGASVEELVNVIFAERLQRALRG